MGDASSPTIEQLSDTLLPKIATEIQRLFLPLLEMATRGTSVPGSSQEQVSTPASEYPNLRITPALHDPLVNHAASDPYDTALPISSSRALPATLGEATPPTPSAAPLAPEKLSYAKALANHKPEVITAESLHAMKPVRKGMYLTVTVDEQLYKDGVSELRDFLIGRIIHVRGDKPLAHEGLITRLRGVWGIKTPWSLTPLGEGYYNIRLSCNADREKIFARRSWQLKPGLLRLQCWVPNFNPFRVNTSVVQAWIRISELPLEYWNKHIITALASAVGTVIKIDERTLSRTMGRFARVLVELDLKHAREETLMFEREGHCSFVSIQYERLPDFCKFCSVIGHTTGHCGGDSRRRKPGSEATISKSKEDRPADTGKGQVEVQHRNSFDILTEDQSEEQPREVGAVSDIEPGTRISDDMVTITQVDCLQVHLPPVEGDGYLANSHTVDTGGKGEPSKARKVSKTKAPTLTKDYNLRNRIMEETPSVEADAHAPGPGLVIPEANSTRPLQVMRNVTNENWVACVDELPLKHGFSEGYP
ncbi:hypothetical protein ACS0TY_035284 [Phlomoides rotata]